MKRTLIAAVATFLIGMNTVLASPTYDICYQTLKEDVQKQHNYYPTTDSHEGRLAKDVAKQLADHTTQILLTVYPKDNITLFLEPSSSAKHLWLGKHTRFYEALQTSLHDHGYALSNNPKQVSAIAEHVHYSIQREQHTYTVTLHCLGSRYTQQFSEHRGLVTTSSSVSRFDYLPTKESR